MEFSLQMATISGMCTCRHAQWKHLFVLVMVTLIAEKPHQRNPSRPRSHRNSQGGYKGTPNAETTHRVHTIKTLSQETIVPNAQLIRVVSTDKVIYY
jgi:hypothetical protein